LFAKRRVVEWRSQPQFHILQQLTGASFLEKNKRPERQLNFAVFGGGGSLDSPGRLRPGLPSSPHFSAYRLSSIIVVSCEKKRKYCRVNFL